MSLAVGLMVVLLGAETAETAPCRTLSAVGKQKIISIVQDFRDGKNTEQKLAEEIEKVIPVRCLEVPLPVERPTAEGR